jgi:hypothetical protein
VEALVTKKRMKDFDKKAILQELRSAINEPDFNLFQFSKKYH